MERSFVEIIAAKRDKLPLSREEIQRFVRAYCSGDVADYQMSAWLMASFLNGLNDDECVALTQAMLHSGTVITLDDVPGLKVDKHSTGGVGDKVSLCLAPIVAAAGVPVPMISGRGLGHTGGTLDKLEAIAGFRTDLPIGRFREIVRDVGVCLIGQTSDLAPADKRIYGLRDVTATVECIPLIVASILSKKLAEGIDGLVLDVKVGRGAFMSTEEKARALATALVRVGTSARAAGASTKDRDGRKSTERSRGRDSTRMCILQRSVQTVTSADGRRKRRSIKLCSAPGRASSIAAMKGRAAVCPSL